MRRPTSRTRTGLRGRLADQDGAVILEFVAVSSLLVLLLYGIVTYGLIFAVQQTVTHAAAEGARAAVNIQPDLVESTSQDVTLANLGWLGDRVTAADVAAAVAPCDGSPTENCVTVTVDYRYGDAPIVPTIPWFETFVPNVIHTEAISSVDG